MTRRAALAPAVLLLMAVAGLGVSAYLTTVHYGAVPLACPTGGVADCAAVTTSRYSTVPGTSLPVTVPGMLWFLVSAALAARALRSRPPAWLPAAHALWALAGVASVIYLVWAETQLHRICEWCTAAHVLVVATFLVALRRVQTAPPADAADAATT